jgi:uncharacterized membrane protein
MPDSGWRIVADFDGASRRRLLSAAVLLGLGLGGFFDGIVLHQILQWHHMVSTPTPPTTLENLELNTLGDGIFHAATWILTLSGVFVLMSSNGARLAPGGMRALVGGMLLGWGLFNLVEGIIDHHLLSLHHVRPGPDAFAYDAGFLVWGAVMLAGGLWLVRSAGAPTGRKPLRRPDTNEEGQPA